MEATPKPATSSGKPESVLLSHVLDATSDGVILLSRDWCITHVNKRAREIMPPMADVLGSNIWESFPAITYEGSPYVEHYRSAMDDGAVHQFEAWHPEPFNGWFAVFVQPHDGGLVLSFRDVTHQRHEAEALRESEARLSAIYSASVAYIGMTAPDGTLLDINRSALSFADSSREDVLGRKFWDGPWFAHTPGAPQEVRRFIARAAAGEFVRTQFAVARPSGETLTFDFSLSPVRDATGKVTFLVPEAHDISSLKRAEKALMQSEKLAAVGRLASSIAHEINNPLEGVTNLIYLARQVAVLPEVQEYLELADRELKRVALIANQTLRFHKQASNPTEITGEDLIDGVLSMYQGRFLNARVRVEQRLRALRPVLCFEGEIRQVLNNLIGNAIDAMNAAGGRLLIRSADVFDWKRRERGLRITIADTGGGMGQATVARIFEPFFTTKGFQGTGLGLWISHEIVERHHGSLRVRSSQTAGKTGTVFSIFLPFDPALRPEEAINPS